MYRFVSTRVSLLECLGSNPIAAKGTEKHLKLSKETTDSIIAQLNKGTGLAPEEVIQLIKFIQSADVFHETDCERLLECLGSRVDMDHAAVATECTDLVARTDYNTHPEKQEMGFIQNYLSAQIWEILAKGSDRSVLLARLSMLLISLGVMHPKEKLFGNITALIEHRYRGVLPPTMQLLALVKAEYRVQRSRRLDQAVGPKVYPDHPAELLTTHAHLHNMAYKNTEPSPVPTWVDLDMLKCGITNSVCRKTNLRVTPVVMETSRQRALMAHSADHRLLDPSINLMLCPPMQPPR